MILDLDRISAWSEGPEAPRFEISCEMNRVVLSVSQVTNPHGSRMGFDPTDLIRAIAELADIDLVELGDAEADAR